jgi:DNA mismatch repair protein MutS2
MIDRKSLDLLQFDKIVGLIEDKCFSTQARALCGSIAPLADAAETITILKQTSELKDILAAGAYFPQVEHDDIQAELRLLTMEGGTLEEDRLFRLARTVEVMNTIVRFLKSKKQVYPELSALAADREANEFVVKEIDRVIDPEGMVKNNASPELARIRKQVIEKRRESDRRFYSYISDLRKHGYLRENEEGFYNGRRTLAVLVEYKAEVPGFVHGKSESGKTIFIEPGATISINNDIAELEIDEHREINRILRELCTALRVHAPQLGSAFSLLIEIDFLRAKAAFAVELQAGLPVIGEGFDLSVENACHPLLLLQNKKLKKATVPLSLKLNAEKRIIVISGPNAGGKTIALKTIGLLQAMLQSGLLIPVKESSVFCFFDKILIDIGDTQSIENELSTYSAKLKTMTAVLEFGADGRIWKWYRSRARRCDRRSSFGKPGELQNPWHNYLAFWKCEIACRKTRRSGKCKHVI